MALFSIFSKKKKDEDLNNESSVNNEQEKSSTIKEKKQNEIGNINKYKSKNAVSSIKKDTPVFVFSVDVNEKFIYVLSMIGNDLLNATVTKLPYKTRPLDEEFFEKLQSILTSYLKDKPSSDVMAVYIVLPNECVSIDLISVPTISKKQINDSINVTLETLYKNKKNLILKNTPLVSNKQYSSYMVLSIQKSMVINFFSTLSNCGMYAKHSSYLANCSLAGVYHLQPKWKNSSFMFVDIKKDNAYFAIAIKGKTIGYYYLQFGYRILETNKLAYENMLVNHDLAEITVLNAKEKAKAKQLTSLAEETEHETETDGSTQTQSQEGKVLGKKVPKRLPKFMQRPVPESEEEMACENFRIFTKWILLVANTYAKKGKEFELNSVLINIPEKFNFVIDNYNKERDNNKSLLEYVPFNKDLQLPDSLKENLELYGALYMKNYNKNQIF